MAIPARHSSSTQGFFQELPKLKPCYTSPQLAGGNHAPEDVTFDRILRLYLPALEDGPTRAIHELSRIAIDPDVLVHSVDAEVNRPVLRSHDTFGRENNYDPLWTTEGWKQLKRIGQAGGVVGSAYEHDHRRYNRRVEQFGLGHVWSSTATMTGCPTAMTDGAAKLLSLHPSDKDGDQPGRSTVVREAYHRLVSRDPKKAWTTGQWMTERSGGSDVSGTETFARRLSTAELSTANKICCKDAHGLELGPWSIDGFKWFSSATDAELSLMLARTSKGLGLFLAPMRRTLLDTFSGRPRTELNGIRIQRLKDKMGTKALPTAELELKGVRAWLIGQEGQGVKKISMILDLTRLHTASGGVAAWGRARHVSRAYSRVRKVRGGLLKDNRQHLRWMAGNTVGYAAAAHFGFFCVALLGALEDDWDAIVKPTNAASIIPKDEQQRSALFRLLTPVLKAQVSVNSVLGIREHLEALGGVGYCENNEEGGLFNIARVFRDNLVSPVWEGTVSVMAEDVVRVLTDKRIGTGKAISQVFAPWSRRIFQGLSKGFASDVGLVEQRLDVILYLEQACDKEELLYRGREILEHIEIIVCSTLLMHDASIDNDEVACEIARRYIRQNAVDRSNLITKDKNSHRNTAMDKAIFLGSSGSSLTVEAKL